MTTAALTLHLASSPHSYIRGASQETLNFGEFPPLPPNPHTPSMVSALSKRERDRTSSKMRTVETNKTHIGEHRRLQKQGGLRLSLWHSRVSKALATIPLFFLQSWLRCLGWKRDAKVCRGYCLLQNSFGPFAPKVAKRVRR